MDQNRYDALHAPLDVWTKPRGAEWRRKSAARPASEKRETLMMRTLSLLAMFLLLALSAIALPEDAGAQAAPPPAAAPQQQNPPTIIGRTQAVIVPVTVKDGRGQLVGDLRKDDFKIFCDEVEQKIGNFSSDPVPLSAVVLIDNDLEQRATAQVQKSLTAISAGFGPSDEVALVTYEQFPETVADFSSNNDLLYTKLKRLELGSHNSQVIADPTTAGPIINGQPTPNGTGIQLHGSQRYKNTNSLDDAIFAAGEMLKDRGRDRRKIIFLISDGSNSRNNTHTFDQTLHSLLVADVSVFSISVNHSVPVGKALVQHGASELQKYATNTGGDTYYAGKQLELERLYSDVTEQARNEYTLTFTPQELTKGQDFHPIEVRVERPGLTVETRQGFYLSAIAAGH
jgi:VWFA-related protein